MTTRSTSRAAHCLPPGGTPTCDGGEVARSSRPGAARLPAEWRRLRVPSGRYVSLRVGWKRAAAISARPWFLQGGFDESRSDRRIDRVPLVSRQRLTLLRV